MKRIRYILFALFFSLSIGLLGQEKDDLGLLKDLTSSISIGVNTQDHEKILNAFVHPTALIYSTYKGLSKGEHSTESNTAKGLSDFVKNAKEKINQEFDYIKVKKISEGRAVVTTHYKVTVAGKNHIAEMSITVPLKLKEDGNSFHSCLR